MSRGTTAPKAIGILAPSGIVPAALLERGTERLRMLGRELRVHSQTALRENYLAGSDDARAAAFLDYAYDDSIGTLWAARGGYGAIRILPLLARAERRRGKPAKKRLFGYSDITLLQDFVRTRWAWETVHAPMPATVAFQALTPREWRALSDVVRGTGEILYPMKRIYSPKGTSDFGRAASSGITGPIVGGNLTLIATTAGTPYAFSLRGGILFLEEVGEAMYAMDRDLRQCVAAGLFRGVRAVVLGTFSDCEDRPAPGTRKPVPSRRMIETLFGELGRELNVPVYAGLPVGHGPKGNGVLPFGRRATILGGNLIVGA